MATSLGLKNIKNAKVRDLARGLLDRNASSRDQRTTLDRLLSLIDIDDLKAFDAVLRSNPLYRHLPVTDEFPEVAPFDDGSPLSLVSEGQLTVDYVAYRITQNGDRLSAAFSLFELLNKSIALGDDDNISLLINTIKEEYGHSLTLARKAAVVAGYAPKHTASFRLCTELVSSYSIPGKNYGMMATIDAIAADFDYLDLKARFRNFASIDKRASAMRKLSHLCFFPQGYTPVEADRIVGASYEFSLIDAAFALLAHQSEGLVNVHLPENVLEAWDALSAMPTSDFVFLVAEDPYADLHAFRAAPAFLEFERFRSLRLALQPWYDLPDLRPAAGAPSRATKRDFFEAAQRMSDLVPPQGGTFDPLPARFDAETAGILTRSCAVVWVSERDPDFSQVSKPDLARLMGRTFEIDRLLSTDVLRRASTTAQDQFVELILQTLLRAHSAATRDSYSFKSKFQKYVREHNNGSILEFAQEVRSLSPNVVHYFISLLDETMLSQMAFLMPSSDSIYQTRADLLEWFADMAEDDTFRQKASQLRLDRKIASVRGTINETRLNIDGVRFRQWIEQEKLPEFSDFIRQTAPNLPPIGELTDASKTSTRFLTAHREPSIRALQALVQCYEEFCRNADFGIASFLGRRIRHGTLRGTLLNALPDPAEVDLPAAAVAQYAAWRQTFSGSIDAYAARLYFRDKALHKNGLLSAEVYSPQQWQSCLVCLKVIYDKGQEDSGILFVPALIESYCWFIFENELENGQASVGEARGRWGTLKLPWSGDDGTAAFEKKVNIAVSDQFLTVASWFKKPPNISPVAQFDHVVQVALREAKDEYPAFNPDVAYVGDRDLQLVGSAYYTTYDVLSIAVRNAAKHGRYPGSLKIQVGVQDSGTGKVLAVCVESLLRGGDTFEEALSRIEAASRAGPQNADVVEEGSGFRKLLKWRSERRILSFEVHRSDVRADGIGVSFTLPFEGIVE